MRPVVLRAPSPYAGGVPDDLVVRDGRISEEKVAELRSVGGETEGLDFKRTADLADPRQRLSIVKDIVSLANTGGGFLIIGCDDQGNFAEGVPPIDPQQWEPANLMGIVAKYVSAPVSLNAAVHVVDGHIVGIVAVQPSMRDLPLPFAMDGEWYENAGKPRYEFRKGQVWIRNGPRNAHLDFHDWDRILASHDQGIRERARAESQSLIDRVIEAIREARDDDSDGGGGSHRPSTPRGPSPLVPGMSWDSIDRGIDDALDAPNDSRLRRYVNELGKQIINPDGEDRAQRQRAIAELVNLAIQADAVDRDEIVELSISTLHRVYGALDHAPVVRDLSGVRDDAITTYWLDIATRVLDLGAYFVRGGSWRNARLVYARPYAPEGDTTYTFQSWLRHAQVQGSRAELLRDEQGRDGGAIYLSVAREAAVEEPRLRPDLGDVDALAVGIAPDGRDPLLDSIAQFDALCSVMSEAGVTEGDAGHYPSFASLRTERTLPILERVATDSTLRTEAFPGKSENVIANALVRTIEFAHNEARRSAGVWFVPTTGSLGRFIAEHRTLG